MASSPLSVTRFRIIFSICWLIIIADHIFLLRWFGVSWAIAVTDSLVNDGLLILACLLVIMMLHYYLPQKEKYFHLVSWCILITVIAVLLTKVILKNIFINDEEYKTFFSRSLWIRSSFDFLLLGCFVLVSVIWYNWQEQSEQEERKQAAEKLAKEAELFKLRQQLQPHFLFNSLNSINALIGARPGEARKMVQQLSDFLRGTMRKEETQFISFSEELEHLKLYLEIEKVRFGYRLKTEMDIAEEALTWKIPSLLLQPLMENAIKFGLYGTIDEVTIALRARVIDKYLVVAVMNPFDIDMQMPPGTGFGLNSLKRRLYLLFARNDLVEINKEKNVFVVVFKIPDINEQSDHNR